MIQQCTIKMSDMKESTCINADLRAKHKQWDELLCPICMDHPHNAVLLQCSSYGKGCRTYICDTSYRHSNCLDRFKKLRENQENNHSRGNSSFLGYHIRESREQIPTYTLPSQAAFGRRMVNEPDVRENYRMEEMNGDLSTALEETLDQHSAQSPEGHLETHGQERQSPGDSGRGTTAESNGTLKCPLCRGEVFGWKIVKEAREYLDLKTRSCSRESCSFSGNYKELRKHARRMHPTTRPAAVELSRQRAWRRLERQREYGDILSAIRSSMPGAIVFGDYVIDNEDGRLNDRDSVGSDEGSGPWWTTFFLFHMFSNPLGSHSESRSSSRAWRSHRRPLRHRNLWGENLLEMQDDDEDRENDGIPIPRRRRRLTRPRPDDGLP